MRETRGKKREERGERREERGERNEEVCSFFVFSSFVV